MMRWLALAVVVVLALAGLAAWEFQRRLAEPLAVPEAGFVLTVEAGDSLRTVVNRLREAGVAKA